MKKNLIISMHPAPYRDPVISKIMSTLCFCVGGGVGILYLYNSDPGHTEWNWSTRKVSVFCKKFPVVGNVHFGLIHMVKKYEKVLIPGWSPLSCLFLLFYMGISGREFVFSCDTIFFRNDIFHRIIYYFVKKAAAFYVPGKRTKSALVEQLGIQPDKIFEGSYMIDETGWVNRVNEQKKMLEKDNGIFYLLFVGKFVQTRDIPLLLEVVKRVRKEDSHVKLILIGCGDFYNDEVKAFISSDLDGIIYKEQVSYDKLSRYYAMADCYVHPGAEPYSLATVQASVSGIPVVSNYNVGAVDDYVESGRNGIILNSKNPGNFSQAILYVLKNYNFFSANAKDIATERLKNRNIDFAVSELEKAFGLKHS